MGQLTISVARRADIRNNANGNVRNPSPNLDAGLIPHSIPAAIAILSEAHRYAQSLDKDVWEFALELQNLSAAGVSINDLRWLACNGYVIHGEELEQSSEGQRVFRRYPGLGFTQRSCFVLTKLGIQFATQIAPSDRKTNLSLPTMEEHASPDASAYPQIQVAAQSTSANEELVPYWDPDRRELRLMGTLVKQFRLPSPNQETVLQAFQEEGWPTRVDDPLPPVCDLEPKRRLHDTIKSLNRHQKAKNIRFMGDGRGEGILWEPR